MSAYVLSWLSLLARWTHLIAGISWIGASFYFVWLDNHLTPPRDPRDAERGVAGELWAVHGGGFYHNQKFPTGPAGEPLSRDLHWFKWEAYTTFLSGIAMLAIVYWADAQSLLIDRSVLDIAPPLAIAVSIATLALGWLVYDAICRVFASRPTLLWSAIGAYVVVVTYALFHVFAPRAAALHAGAMLGTIMVANVFFIIIPGQQRVVAQLRAGEIPDPRPGVLGKMRSVHNTYFTLPVLFAMISAHYPMVYAGQWGWLVLLAIGAAGVLVRRFFVLSHRGRIVVALPAAAAAVLAAVAVAIAPRPQPAAAPVAFAQVAPIVAQRCAVCHAASPTQAGVSSPPMGVQLDTPERIAANAQRIEAQAVRSHAMPLGNVTGMTDAERATLGAWIAAGARLQ